MTKLRILLP